MRLFWLALSLICALIAVLTYPKPKIVQAPVQVPVQVPVQTPTPVQPPVQANEITNEKPKTDEEIIREQEEFTRTHPELTGKIQQDPEPPQMEVPDRYKDMGLARYSGQLARDEMQKKEEEK